MLVFDTDVLISLGCAQGNIVNHVEAEWPEILVVTDTVRDELKYLVSTQARLNCARHLLGRPWVKDAEVLDDAQVRRVELTRLSLGGVNAGELEHQGESSVIVYCEDNPGAIAVLADRDARTLAAKKGFTVWTTLDIVRKLVASGRVNCGQAVEGYERMSRVSRLPPGRTAANFCVSGCSLH